MCGNHVHRNFTFPASARTAFIACDALNARTVTMQKYHYLFPIFCYTAAPLSCVLSLSRFNQNPFSSAIITAKPPSIWVVSKSFFEKVFDTFCSMTSSAVIITVKLCSLPYVSKKILKNFSTFFAKWLFLLL